MNLLEKAVTFATEKHSGTYRKGSDIPYIIHPMEALAIAAGMTSDIKVLAATVLHDVVVEDCGQALQHPFNTPRCHGEW